MTNLQNLADLDKALLAAHESEDLTRLVDLYSQAGEAALLSDVDGACFYFTHAMVFALECGDERADEIRKILIENGREEAL